MFLGYMDSIDSILFSIFQNELVLNQSFYPWKMSQFIEERMPA